MTNITSTNRKRRMAREPQANAEAHAKAGIGIPTEPPSSSTAEKRLNKTERVLALLQREGGATLDELVEATGWLPHTTRAALTGLKKRGHRIDRTKVDGVSRYGVVEAIAE